MKKFVVIYLLCLLVGCSRGETLDLKVEKLEKASLKNDLPFVEKSIQDDIFFSNKEQTQEVVEKVISYGYDEVAQRLIKEGENQLSFEPLLSVAIYTGGSYEQDSEPRALITDLIKKVKNVNKKDKEGNTPLLYAIEKGNLPLVKEIEKRGGDYSVINKKGEGVMLKSVYSQNHEMFTYILKKQPTAKELTLNGSTSLIESIKMGKKDISLQLIEREKLLDQQDKDGKTALIYASEFGQIEVVNALLDKEVNTTIKSVTNESAYDYAVKWGNTEVSERLKEMQ